MQKVVNNKIRDVGDKEIESNTINSSTGNFCDGNACADITVTATSSGGGLSFHNNNPNKSINIAVSFASGFGSPCSDPVRFTILPLSHSDWANGAYCNSFTAIYV